MNTPKRLPPRSASIWWIPSPAAAPTAISRHRIPRRLTASASTAGRPPITSSCTSRRSSRGRGCCTGSIRRCDDDRKRQSRKARCHLRRWRHPSLARFVLRPPQGPQAPPASGDLIEHLLPRLAIDIASPAPSDLADMFDPPADEIRLEIGLAAANI